MLTGLIFDKPMFESRRINDYEYGIGKILSKVISIITVEKLRELKKDSGTKKC